METNKIICGDSIQVLKTLPSESINCVMTSPPYWALREYGSSVESIWDGKEDCEHKWETGKVAGKPEQKFCSTKCLNTLSNSERTRMRQTSNFCSKCGAWKGQLGLEPTFDLYIKHLCNIFDEVKRVLRKDGTCWVNLGDTYYSLSGGKFLNDNLGNKGRNSDNGLSRANELKGGNELEQKNLTLIPFRFAIEMQSRGWILRNVIIWNKPNCIPSSVKDRFTVDFEYVFFFVKNKKYWFETQYEKSTKIVSETFKDFNNEIREVYLNDIKRERADINGKSNGEYIGSAYGIVCGTSKQRQKRVVWSICTQPFSENHFATYPEELCETPIKAGCPEFVCNKCGKAREKIYNFEKHFSAKNVSGKSQNENSIEFGLRYKDRYDSVPIFKGYSNCECNAGFSGGIVLDPFFGAGTTGLVALKQNRKFIGIELNENYIKIAKERLKPYLEQNKLT